MTVVVLVMVGLPARGKSFTARKLQRYLQWQSIPCRIFNVGGYRRKLQPRKETSDVTEECSMADFFDPDNEVGRVIRAQAAQDAMQDLLQWCSLVNNCDSSIGSNEHGTRVAIYDATNSTKERRAWIAHSCSNYNVLFIELVCRDEALVEETLRTHKIDSPDYANCRDADQAVADFRKRIAHYATFYESIDVREGISFVRAVDLGAKMEMHRMNDGCLLVRRIAYFLACTAGAIGPKSLFLTRHGESELNVQGRIGGDGELSGAGWEFARRLVEFVREHSSILAIWTSTYKRTHQTAEPSLRDADASQETKRRAPIQMVQWRALDELNAGVCEGMTYADIEALHPTHALYRSTNKFLARYPGPGGESYHDLITRLEPVILEIERANYDLMIVGHQAVLRCLIGYYRGTVGEEMPYIEVPLHRVVEVQVNGYGDGIRVHDIGPEAVNTHRPRTLPP